MTVAVGLLLGAGVLAAWLGTAALVRLGTPFERLHVVTFLNLAAGLPIAIAAVLTGGASAGSIKVVLIFLSTALTGALLGHATARALHLREGERR